MTAVAKLAPLLDGEGKKPTWLADRTSTSHLPPLALMPPHQSRCLRVPSMQREEAMWPR